MYKYIDFPSDINKIEIRLKPGKNVVKIQLVMDQTWHSPFATIDIPGTLNPNEWVSVQANVKPTPGIHGLWLKFSGDGDTMIDIDWFRFLN